MNISQEHDHVQVEGGRTTTYGLLVFLVTMIVLAVTAPAYIHWLCRIAQWSWDLTG